MPPSQPNSFRASRRSGRLGLPTLAALGAVMAAVLASACASTGSYTWVTNLPQEQLTTRVGDYAIAPGDVISVHVFNQEGLSAKAKVRSDGKISVPFLGDVQVQAKRPTDLAHELEVGFKQYVVEPRVTVTVDEFQPLSVSVLGYVAHPGMYPLDRTAGVLQALASAGGPTEFASRDRIFVLRRSQVGGNANANANGNGSVEMSRVRFTYELLVHNDSHAALFTLRTGDVVVVE